MKLTSILTLILCAFFLSAHAVEIEYELVSKYPGGSAVGYSFPSDISQDGRYVSFYSYLNGIVEDDTNRAQNNDGHGELLTTLFGPDGGYIVGYDQFLYDRESGEITRVSVREDGSQFLKANSLYGQLSPDASSVAYISSVTDAIPSIPHAYLENIYLYNRNNNTLRFTNLYEGNTILSMSYEYKFFSNTKILCQSKDPLIVPESSNIYFDWGFFIYDIETGQLGDYLQTDQGEPLYGMPTNFDVSDDGRYIAYIKKAGIKQPEMAYLYDSETKVEKLVSADPDSNEANAPVRYLQISGDGRYIIFFSGATNIAPEKMQIIDGELYAANIYLFDRIEQIWEVVPLQNEKGALLNGSWDNILMSKNGRYLFYTFVRNQLFRYDRQTQQTILVISSIFPSIYAKYFPSYDGTSVVFSTDEPLVPEDTTGHSNSQSWPGNDVYVATIKDESAAADWKCY